MILKKKTILLITMLLCTTLFYACGKKEEDQNNLPIDENSGDKITEAIEKINKYIIAEQSFDILLNDWGNVTFVSCMPMPDSEGATNPCADVSFYLIASGQVNADDKDDVIVGIFYCTGAGPQGEIPRVEVRVYEDNGDEFVYNQNLCNDLRDLPYDTTAGDVKSLLEAY